MFALVSERKMLSVRSVLLVLWLILIASLFWDPFSAALTDQSNASSPFRVDDHSVVVQDTHLQATPYQMGARIFWTMLVPIVPLFLMVFGHEAWRRVCPLSLASQIPGYLGLRRFRHKLERRTGLLGKSVPLMARNGWFARNAWYVQFGFLFLGVSVRILLINSDRHALGIALLTVIGLAMLTGMLWGGKTWCNYFCPANVVQKIYTEPGGIFESAPHSSKPQVPQSMCRKPGDKGDVSACVACTANCGDIDLQRGYWSGVTEMPRRNVYYMFFGLIWGFYGYYYAYSGSWDYYFSGIWTHEDGIAQKVLNPGFFLFSHSIPVPKLIATPLFLAVCCGISLLIGRMLEGAYRRFRNRNGAEISDQVLVHQCLSVAAWASINAFYLFGGRPNLLLLTPLAGRVVDIVIVALTTIWLRQVLQMSPKRYQQESMAFGLLRELKNLKLDFSKFLDSRKLEHLRPSEIYLLATVLPGFSHEQKLNAYRKILDEEIQKGSTANASSLKLLDDFRQQMNITEDEHGKLLDQLGYSELSTVDLASITEEEKETSLAQYRSILESTVASRLEKGADMRSILLENSVRTMLDVLRKSLQISGAEHEVIVREVFSNGIVAGRMNAILDQLLSHQAARLCIEASKISDPLGLALLELLLDFMSVREEQICLSAFASLANFEPDETACGYAEELASLASSHIGLLLRQQRSDDGEGVKWREIFDPVILEVLQAKSTDRRLDAADTDDERRSHRMAMVRSNDLEACLSEILSIEDPIVKAIGLTVFGYINPSLARSAGMDILSGSQSATHPLLWFAAEDVSGNHNITDTGLPKAVLQATLRMGGQADDQVFKINQEHTTIGRAADNDIVVTHPDAWTYHVAIQITQGQVRVVRLDGGDVFMNGRQIVEESALAKRGSVMSLGSDKVDAPKILLNWQGDIDSGQAIKLSPVLRLAMLACNPNLKRLSISTLADIAIKCTTERYSRGAKLQISAETETYFIVHQGAVRLFDPEEMNFVPGIEFRSGSLIGFQASNGSQDYAPEVASDFAIIMNVPPKAEVRLATPRSRFYDGSITLPSGAGSRKQIDGTVNPTNI